MITENQLINLGFKKVKSYKKRELGVSSYLFEMGGFYFTWEKNLGSDFGDRYFMPTIKYANRIIYIQDIEHVKEFIEVFRLKY
jgi:hypothetical protein